MTDGILRAEDLAKDFKEHSVAEFFRKNKQMLGLVGKIRTFTTIIHEFVTNSLDACEEAGILPDIEIQIKELGNEYYEIAVKDNGPGLTRETVGKAFGQLLAGTKFHRLIQMRGQQGIGAAGIVMLSQITTGKTSQIITGTGKGNPISLEITIDPKLNQPKITNLKELNTKFRGTAIKARFKELKYIRSDQAPLEYLRRTAIANPHAKITITEPTGEKITFERSIKSLPKKPIQMKPHPKGITVDELVTLAKATDSRKTNSFLRNDFDRMGDKAVREIQENISFDLNKDPKQMGWDEAEEIVKAFRKINFIAPRTDGLRPIGEDRIRKSLETIITPEFMSVITRKPTVYSGGFPFQIEAAVAYGGKAGKMSESPKKKDDDDEAIVKKVELMRFANLSPLLFDGGGCATTKAVQSVDWKRYGIKDMDNAPITVFLNMISVHIPYTSAGKQAIADEEEIMEELRLALMECGRKTGRYIAGKKKEQEKMMKRQMFFKYIPEVAFALGKITKTDEESLKKRLQKIVLDKLKLEEKEEEDKRRSTEFKAGKEAAIRKLEEGSEDEISPEEEEEPEEEVSD